MTKKEALLSEVRVKEILGIDDFRHMTKDGAIQFVSMMSQMEPEVALKVLEQFPDLARTAVTWASDFKETMLRELDVNAAASKEILAAMKTTLNDLNALLGKGGLSTDEYKALIEGVCRIQENMIRLHESDQRHGIQVLETGIKALKVLGMFVLGGLGVGFLIKAPAMKR